MTREISLDHIAYSSSRLITLFAAETFVIPTCRVGFGEGRIGLVRLAGETLVKIVLARSVANVVDDATVGLKNTTQ